MLSGVVGMAALKRIKKEEKVRSEQTRAIADFKLMLHLEGIKPDELLALASIGLVGASNSPGMPRVNNLQRDHS